MSEMTEAQVHVYAEAIARMIGQTGVFFEQNQNNSAVGFIDCKDHIRDHIPWSYRLRPRLAAMTEGRANLWANVKPTFAQDVPNRETRLDDLEGLVDGQTRLIESLQTTLQERTGRLQNLEQAHNEKSQRILAVERTLEEKSQRILAVERTLEEKSQRILAVERTLEEKSQRILAVEQTLEERNQRIKILENSVSKRIRRLALSLIGR